MQKDCNEIKIILKQKFCLRCRWIYERTYMWTAEKDTILDDHHIFLRSSNICSFIYSFTSFTFYGYITNSRGDQLPDGLIAQLVVHCTGIAEVMGSNLVQVWIFFQALISQLLKLCV